MIGGGDFFVVEAIADFDRDADARILDAEDEEVVADAEEGRGDGSDGSELASVREVVVQEVREDVGVRLDLDAGLRAVRGKTDAECHRRRRSRAGRRLGSGDGPFRGDALLEEEVEVEDFRRRLVVALEDLVHVESRLVQRLDLDEHREGLAHVVPELLVVVELRRFEEGADHRNRRSEAIADFVGLLPDEAFLRRQFRLGFPPQIIGVDELQLGHEDHEERDEDGDKGSNRDVEGRLPGRLLGEFQRPAKLAKVRVCRRRNGSPGFVTQVETSRGSEERGLIDDGEGGEVLRHGERNADSVDKVSEAVVHVPERPGPALGPVPTTLQLGELCRGSRSFH
mmetsp:Transcript_4989/g.12821  ORF Transcript_4989/g.12821 Transcript_4989/m.12821 type:complete len:340 (+) Transcript_4989:949-1968(+)